MIKTDELLKLLKSSKTPDFRSLETITFAEMIKGLMAERNLTSAALIEQAGLHRTYGYQILAGNKVPSKPKVMQLALAMKLDLHDTNNLLSLSNNGHLYPKIAQDAIYISCLFQHKTVMECNEILAENGFEPLL